jgi:hypothetical protein
VGLAYRPTGTSVLVASRVLYCRAICQPTEEVQQAVRGGTHNRPRRSISLCIEQEHNRIDISDK